MDKQTTIAFVLIGFILILWLFLNNPEPQPVKQSTDSTLVKQQPPDTTKKEKQVVAKTETQQDTSSFGKVFHPADAKEKIITIENSLVKFELNSVGAKIKRLFLKNYKTWYANGEKDNFYKNHVQLINPADSGDFNLMFITKDGKLVNTSHAEFKVETIKPYYKLEEKDSLLISFSLQIGNDSYIKKNYIIKGNDYALKCDVEMVNMDKYISNYRYDVIWANGINFVERNSVDEANYSNASAFSGGEQAIVKASANEKINKEFNGKVDWLGIRNKYFAVLIAPQKPVDEGGAYIEGRQKQIGDGLREIYNASLKVPFNNQSYQKNSFLLYIGPVEYDILKKYGKNFESIVDFGSFFGLKFIIRPISEYILLPLFKFLHLFIPNWGLVIIVFSLIIKVALHPLTRSQMKSMKKMQMLQPKITELKEKFKDDPQKMNKETMKLYSTYGINPAGGCLPLLLQMPILVALWGLFNVAIELRQANFVWWINNLSAPDVIFTLPFRIPIFGINQISALPLLLGITMFIQQKMSVKDPSQKMLVYLMPVMFTLMFMGFPSGLNLYYFMFNLFSIVQQYYVNHSHANVELVPVKNPKKSGGFMARMMDAAEKQSQQQAAARKKK
ncbi:MAG: membrane protein insertase YidC [Ignavibacteriales bacterium]|nr:MAG: membrane protein insertase YidC [Ignavibacteriales bacterium]